jgi:hypothetical protein
VASDHVLLRASTDFVVLAGNAETCLRGLNFEFFLNRGRDLVEFEITKPIYFRIVVEKRKDAEVGNLLLPSIKTAKGCTLDFWFNESEAGFQSESQGYAKLFLKSLMTTLPSPPWEGLKFRESGKEKKKWGQFVSQ